MSRLARNLKLIRKERWRISQDKFSQLMSSTRSKINSYENGGVEPSIAFILRLQAYTQLSVKELFYDLLAEDQIPPLPLEAGEFFVAEPESECYEKAEIESVLKNQTKIMDRLKEMSTRIAGIEKALGHL